ncbi:MAG: hypothetical protein OEL56_02925 [Nitrosopumilus sp.]|nr:hypothetical protein [Nitrosopumilus sp.]MDH3489379.1 hypothetical protein [Nitrosopumilus sp.]MDH3516377.1 hypothetical protein [Nitrosopumilus sp.]MDH3564142.1 hypothetical protein [Nitrosopumilus sp.]MDH5418213.1 hypothetical protein [Nitrosopumilus sp.]
MENENSINNVNNVVMKKVTFVTLLVGLVIISSVSSFFVGSYIADLDSDKNMQFDFNPEISKLESQIEDNPVVAEVNGQEIRLDEVNDVIKVGFSQGQRLNSASALDMIITKILLLEEAQNRDVVITIIDAEEKLIATYTQAGLSKEQFEEKLVEAGTTYEQALNGFREEFIINEVLIDEISKTEIQVSDEEVKIFFEENKDMIKAQVGNNTVFNDVSSQVKVNLLEQKQQQIVLDLIKHLEQKMMIIIYEDMLQ